MEMSINEMVANTINNLKDFDMTDGFEVYVKFKDEYPYCKAYVWGYERMATLDHNASDMDIIVKMDSIGDFEDFIKTVGTHAIVHFESYYEPHIG